MAFILRAPIGTTLGALFYLCTWNAVFIAVRNMILWNHDMPQHIKFIQTALYALATVGTSATIFAASFFTSSERYSDMVTRYAALASVVTVDRNGHELSLRQNQRGFYARYSADVPPFIAEALISQEDRYFMYHPGINPLSVVRAMFSAFRADTRIRASSTISQQLAKMLMGNEQQRTLRNKLSETVSTFALELHAPKRQILTMYANTAYFGNGAQGIEEASRVYAGTPASSLTGTRAAALAVLLHNPGAVPKDAMMPDAPRSRNTAAEFEIKDLTEDACRATCRLTIDAALTDSLRDILLRNISSQTERHVANGAIVALKLPENEILAIVGSPDPSVEADGYKINMAVRPRPIGSTVKPFIYALAFKEGLRPYTLVEDREYRYAIGTGFSLYPKNYDLRYRGQVTLHYALANSLNVPAVRTLEYVGVDAFSSFLKDKFGFKAIRNFSDYGLGIALGGLEMDLLTLSHFFTVFPNGSVLKPMTIRFDTPGSYATQLENAMPKAEVADPVYIALVNRILSDRQTGVEQFGATSPLNLPFENYAVKTGTSREFHDSWTIGYTPDFLVGVWMGNADNTPMDEVSGSVGAGRVWQEAMTLLYGSLYNRNTPFSFKHITEISSAEGIDYGLQGDDYEVIRQKLLSKDATIIIEPHDGDVVLLDGSAIPLKAKEFVSWFVNGKRVGEGTDAAFTPSAPGEWTIEARTRSGEIDTVRFEAESD